MQIGPVASITGQMSQYSLDEDDGGIESELADLDTLGVSLSVIAAFYGEQSGNCRNLRGSVVD